MAAKVDDTVIKTHRLRLRLPETGDVPRIVHGLGNPDIVRFMNANIPQPYTDADALAWIGSARAADTSLVRMITFAENNLAVGCVSVETGNITDARGSRYGLLGYWLMAEHHGRGIMPEAVSSLVEYAFRHSGFDLIGADTAPSNRASQRVLEKIGFSRKPATGSFGHSHSGEACDIYYEVTRDAWQRIWEPGRISADPGGGCGPH